MDKYKKGKGNSVGKTHTDLYDEAFQKGRLSGLGERKWKDEKTSGIFVSDINLFKEARQRNVTILEVHDLKIASLDRLLKSKGRNTKLISSLIAIRKWIKLGIANKRKITNLSYLFEGIIETVKLLGDDKDSGIDQFDEENPEFIHEE